MKPGFFSFLFCVFSAPAQASPVIEFLWDQHDGSDLARSEALMLTPEAPEPAVCWKSEGIGEHTDVTWRVLDADSNLVYEDRYQQEPADEMVVSCRPVTVTNAQSAFGSWQFQLYFDGRLAGERSIEVVEKLADWSRFDVGHFPYVRGRTNYRPDIRADYRGEFRMALTVDSQGEVSDVELVDAADATELARRMVRASGYLFRFPPNPDREDTGLVIHQPVTLRPR